MKICESPKDCGLHIQNIKNFQPVFRFVDPVLEPPNSQLCPRCPSKVPFVDRVSEISIIKSHKCWIFSTPWTQLSHWKDGMNIVNFSRLLRSTPASHESVCRWHGTPQRKKNITTVSVVLIEKIPRNFHPDHLPTKIRNQLLDNFQFSNRNHQLVSIFHRVFHHFKHWGLHFNELQLAHQLCSNLTTSCVIFFPLVQNLLARPEIKPWLPDSEKGYFGMVPSGYQKHLKAKSPRRLLKKFKQEKNLYTRKRFIFSEGVQHASTAYLPSL